MIFLRNNISKLGINYYDFIFAEQHFETLRFFLRNNISKLGINYYDFIFAEQHFET